MDPTNNAELQQSATPEISSNFFGKNTRSLIAVAAGVTALGLGAYYGPDYVRTRGWLDPDPLPPSAPITGTGNFMMSTDFYGGAIQDWTNNGKDGSVDMFAQIENQKDPIERDTLLYYSRVAFPRQGLAKSFNGFIAAQSGKSSVCLPLELELHEGFGNAEYQNGAFIGRRGLRELKDFLRNQPEALKHLENGTYTLVVRAVTPQEFPSNRGDWCVGGYRMHEDNLMFAMSGFIKTLPSNEIFLAKYPHEGPPQLRELKDPKPGDEGILLTFKMN